MEELQNLTPLYNKEFYLAYLCGEDVELPIPDGNTEHYLAYLCGMDVPIPDPLYTKEFYLAYKCGMDVELPEPGPYRIDQYLAKWCGMDVEVPEPMYRIEYWLAQLANSGELKTVSGNPISVSDALARPAESLVIEINPIQDLHGYDNPWPAGGGANKLPAMVDGTYEGNGVKAVVVNGIATLSGTTSATGNAFSIPLASTYTVPDGAYLHCLNSVANGSLSPSFEFSEDVANNNIPVTLNPANRIYSVPSAKAGCKIDRIRFYIGTGLTISGTFAPMICMDSTERSFSPYSNICPITGFTGVNVQRTGKNLLPNLTGIYNSTQLNLGVDSDSAVYSHFLKAGTYTLSVGFAEGVHYGAYYRGSNDGSNTNIFTVGSQDTSGTFTISKDGYYRFWLYYSNGVSKDGVEWFQLELGSTATYAPYTGTTYAITWQTEAGTVYGGSLDVTSGVLTAVPYYGSYNSETLVGPWVSSMDKYVAGTTPTTGAQVVDMGGTGTEIQLTPTEIQMLLGDNTIWNDVGDMTLEYLADGPADDIDALQILLGNRYVNNGAEDEASDREALDILLGGNTR